MVGTGGHVWMTFQTFGFGSPFKIWRFFHPFWKSTDPALKFDWVPCRLVWKAQSSETSYFALQNFGWRQHNSNTTQHGCIELHRTVKTKNPLCLHLKKNPKLSVETGGTLPCPNLTFKAWENERRDSWVNPITLAHKFEILHLTYFKTAFSSLNCGKWQHCLALAEMLALRW